MAWTVEISAYAAKQMSSLDKPTQKRIYTFLQKLEAEADPFKLLIPYTANMAGLWKKRLGDWRIVIEAEHGKLTLIVMKIGHRSKVYR
ncbi:type II toxin-antitoxin system RelE family toxin [Methylobacter tundripaludum]|uniref:type II toxin-antitoxin system RelE family toxin n=1 Tax=Methylobacter tundripaludum TaxID=173365 RepID=UPI0004DEDD38|nr:type II toxin-antitoxin system RelE/ParE family toxin [Methylobacter tundripaludum]